MFFRPLSILALSVLPLGTACADLILDIDLANQTFDWVDGTSVSRPSSTGFPPLSGPSFGTFAGAADSASITMPLPVSNSSIVFDFASFSFLSDGTEIVGISLNSAAAALGQWIVSGTADAAAQGVFDFGSFADFENLTPGTYRYASTSGDWNDDVVVRVSGSVPAPASVALLSMGLAAGLGFVRRPGLARANPT